MRYQAALLFAVLMAAQWLAPSFAGAEYKAVFKPARDSQGVLRIAIRRLTEGPRTRYLTVEPESFATALIEGPELGKADDDGQWKSTPYAVALEKYNAPAAGLQDSGLTRGGSGLFLTVDLCPSTKKMDMELFKAAIGEPHMKDRPLPIAIAVSGMWMERHEDELAWILGMEKKGDLSITWVNHSFSHPYDRDKPLEDNFLLKPGVDFEKEVLEDELALIKRGLLPSPFFRFPGLVADKGLLEKLKNLFLIPVGADAWLAKGGKPREGSIILVHGNGNEPEGVKKLLEFYGEKKKSSELGELRFLPLREAIGR
ncbi:hypothetical protein BAC1_00880 [uncultured bacterium]|nr:hypothetical protein BAC1_00880 [uncultured bacterium]